MSSSSDPQTTSKPPSSSIPAEDLLSRHPLKATPEEEKKEGKKLSGYRHERIGFVGMGNMGLPMALNLSRWLSSNSLPPLTLWNRTTSKLPPTSPSLKHASSLISLAESCDVIITSLSSDTSANEVYTELFKGAKNKYEGGKMEKGSSTIFVDTSTLYTTTAGGIERKATEIPRTYYLQCPVFGPPPVAEKAQLVIVLSGDYFAKEHVKNYLVPAIGRKFIDVGSNVERAAAFKLNGNSLILGIIENLAESMTLASKTGVGADLLMEFIKEFLPAPSFLNYGAKIVSNSFEGETGFTVEGGLKDANHIRHLAASVDVTIPIIDIAHRNLITARANGGGDKDWSSLVAGPRLGAGLMPFTGVKAPVSQDTGFGAKREDFDTQAPMRIGGIKEVKNF